MSASPEYPDKSTDDLQELRRAPDLLALENSLTKIMAQQRAQPLIRGDDLAKVVAEIVNRVPRDNAQLQLVAAAMLGRVAALARGREQQVYRHAETVFTQVPPAIDTLQDGNEKVYAAQVLRHVTANWVVDYCARQSLEIDSADNARKELLSITLERSGSLSVWLRTLSMHGQLLAKGTADDGGLKRCRRVLGAMAGVATDWQGDLGAAPGPALAECISRFLGERPQQPDIGVLTDVIDQALSLLSRMIQLRFSHALQAETYALIERSRNLLGIGLWIQFLAGSRNIARVRTDLLESALVLARQNRTDRNLSSMLSLVYATKAAGIADIRQHFASASDLDPEIRRWWESLGLSLVGHTEREHKIGNSEDEQIGALLLEVESARDAMEKVGRAIVPLLDISDPVLAATARRAAASYIEIAQIATRLARMRRLTRSNLKGERIEFNPLEHQMLGERNAGIRKVRVVRDGIQKEFAGRTKTLVKPWVEPEE